MTFDDREAINALFAHYQQRFAASPRAQDAARRLGLTNPMQWDSLRIGFVDRTAGPTLAPCRRAASRHTRDAWRRAGLLSADGRERFRGCLVLPVFNSDAALIQCAARPLSVQRGSLHAVSQVLTPRGATLVAAAPARDGDTVTICTDAFDAASLGAEGLSAVFAVVGPIDERSLDVETLRSAVTGARLVQLATPGTREGKQRVNELAAALDLDARGIPMRLLPSVLGQRPALYVQPDSASAGKSTADVVAAAMQALGRSPSAFRCQVEAWLSSLADAGLRPATLVSRGWQLRPLATFLSQHGIGDLRAVTAPLVRTYAQSLQSGSALPRGPNTRRKLCTALRLLLRFTIADPRRRERLESALPQIRGTSARLMHTLTESAVWRILRAIPKAGPLALRDRALISLLYATGLRRAEVAGLDIGDIDAEVGLVRVRDGKGGRGRVAPLGGATTAILEYIERVRAHDVKCSAERALFVSSRGTRLSNNTLSHRSAALVRLARSAGGSCHIFRHTAATHMHDRGADIRDLQVFLGHASLSSTQIYTSVSTARVIEVHRQTHPMGRPLGITTLAMNSTSAA